MRQHANHKTRELAGTGGFERRKDAGSLCGNEKLVIPARLAAQRRGLKLPPEIQKLRLDLWFT